MLHLYMGEPVSSGEAAQKIVRTIFENYKIPYMTLTPTFSICPKHGYLPGRHEFCPKCDAELGIVTETETASNKA
jgi:ribonucleoside-triphosphate reductase